MSDKVKLSKDGNAIDFLQGEHIPTSVKKLRQSPEIEGFYKFLFEHDLQKEAFEILDRISQVRKAKRQLASKAEKAEKAAEKAAAEKASPKKGDVKATKSETKTAAKKK